MQPAVPIVSAIFTPTVFIRWNLRIAREYSGDIEPREDSGDQGYNPKNH